MRRLLVLLIGLAATLLVSGPVAADAESARRSPESAYGRQAVRATNAARVAQDLRPLRVDRCLQRFARAQARLMAQREEMFHQDLGPVLSGCGLSTTGENVAYGYSTGRSAVVDGWLDSDGHRANIMSTSFRLVAVAARRGHDGRWYAAQVFGAR
jgi:uncharacterized protein YkwD